MAEGGSWGVGDPLRLPGLQGVNRGLRVLLVEDSEIDAELIREVLETDRRVEHVHHANDGAEAIELLKQMPAPDLVITDLNMPTVSGAEFMRHLRDLERNAPVDLFNRHEIARRFIPIVVLSCSSRISDFHDAMLVEANSFVTKPDEYDALKKVLKKIVKAIIWGGELPRYLPCGSQQ